MSSEVGREANGAARTRVHDTDAERPGPLVEFMQSLHLQGLNLTRDDDRGRTVPGGES